LEKEKMDVKDLIYTENNVLPLSALSSFIKWLNTQDHNFATSQLAGNVVDKSIRKVQDFTLLKNTKSQTEIHWLNFLLHNFIKGIDNYQKKFKVNTGIVKALEVTVLKYTNSSHYKYHIDHGGTTPRTLSLIYLCNNDYEGGDLVFGSVDQSKEILRIKKEANKLIIWPSNFIYPHKVEPVTKGTRYSIVSWSL